MASIEQRLSYRRSWRRRLRAYLALARISNSPTVFTNALAGAALAGAVAPNRQIALVAAAMVLFYTAGMFLNDLCDYAIDCRVRPERPLPSGDVSRAEAAGATVVMFSAGLALVWAVGIAPFLAGLVLIGLIVLYDSWHKTNPLSPVFMAACRMMVYAVAFLAFQPRLSVGLGIWAGALGLYIIGLTALAKTEGAEDEQHGTRGGATVEGLAFGASRLVARYWPLALVFAPALAYVAQGPAAAGLPLLALFLGWSAYSLSFAYRGHGRSVGRAIGALIAGVALVDSLALATSGAWVGVVLAIGAFGLTIVFQRYIKGT